MRLQVETKLMCPDSVLIGSAGEHYVLYQLHRRGILAALSPAGAREADVLVFDANKVGKRVQVKTRTHGADGGWHMGVKHEKLVDDGLIYAFVDLEPDPPVTYIVPSAVVAEVVSTSHKTCRATPGRAGQQHNDTPMRRLRPDYGHLVPNRMGRWLDEYRERWDLIC